MPNFTLNCLAGSVSFSLTLDAARELQGAIAQLMADLKAVAIAQQQPGSQRPAPRPQFEYQWVGAVFLEIFCNPNIYPSPFAAKVLVTVRDDKIRLNAEAELTRLWEDINQYVEAEL